MANKTMELLPPRKDGGMPAMAALNNRKSTKEFSENPISQQQLSDLLWAMFGYNRTDIMKRTAPTAKNWQEVELYVINKEGVYIYDAKENKLKLSVEGDMRHIAGLQEYPKYAPLNILLVSDLDKIEKVNDIDKKITTSANAGFISQNAYIYCASENLACVARLMIDQKEIAKTLQLNQNQWVSMALTVGNMK